MLPVNIVCEYMIDFLMIIAGICGIVYIHGEQRYQEGIQKGMRMQRQINRAIRRGEVYRLK